jgi:phosphoglycolate phosphatase
MYLVLFDVDGTLVDSQNMISAIMATAFAAVGRPAPAREAVLGTIGLSLPEAMHRLAPDADAAAVDALVTAYKGGFHAARTDPRHHEALFPGAHAFLDRLAGRDDVLLGIATGKSKRGVRAILDLHDLNGRFVTIQTADDHPSKPHPSMVITALAETGVAAENTVMIGDSSFDMVMARAAGAHALGVSWGYQSPAALASAGAEIIIDRYEDADGAIARLLAPVSASE